MTARRLIELWEAPQGYRLASVVATTYELQADFLEEDLLPVALGLRTSPAQGREFRLELEHALVETEVTIFFHPGRYQRGLRRSPRIDLIPLPEGRRPKLHAKVALIRFVASASRHPADQVVRLLVGSANLTGPGYRTNIEVAASIDDAPGASAEKATAVRDAVDWLERLIGPSTDQVAHQLRDMRAVFANRTAPRTQTRLQFVGLPSTNGFPSLAGPGETVATLTVASPFWPSGNDLSDFAGALVQLCGGRLEAVRLIGPSSPNEQGHNRPVIPGALVRSLLGMGTKVEVSAADPSFGYVPAAGDDEGEFDELAERRRANSPQSRSLHAKVLLASGDETTRLAVGSFNLSRKGLGFGGRGNSEAGLLWTLPKEQSDVLSGAVSFATDWRKVADRPDEYVVEPSEYEGDNDSTWPAFILSLRARPDQLLIKGDAETWPDEVVIRMRDIRSRPRNQDRWFDDWIVRAPDESEGVFSESTALSASWLDHSPKPSDMPWSALPDLEAIVSWDGHEATLPVVFEDKDSFPVVESPSREDEQSLIAWFLGLRAAGELDADGFAHSIDPIQKDHEPPSASGDILSYLMRDFVHALPGIRNRLTEAGITETGLRTALLGPRSPVELARQALHAFQDPQPGKPRKTAVSTAFQLEELRLLLENVSMPGLADGVDDALRAEAVAEVSSALEEVVSALPATDRTEAVSAYLCLHRGKP